MKLGKTVETFTDESTPLHTEDIIFQELSTDINNLTTNNYIIIY